MDQHKLKLIFNPVSRRGAAEKFLKKLERFLKKEKIEFDLVKTNQAGEGTCLAKEAIDAGFDTIISVGGDGLTNEIANGMIGSPATLGIVPAGGGNDFCKMLGESEANLEESFTIIKEHRTKEIDVGVINGRYFLNVVGIGLSGEIGSIKNNTPKILRGYFAYLLASFLGLVSYKPKTITVQIDGNSSRAKISLIDIGNGRFSGGGFQTTPNAKIDDGFFDICLAEFPGKLRLLWDMGEVIKGRHIFFDYVKMHRAKSVKISSDEILTAHIDGEIMQDKRFEITILPKKLKVLIKRGHSG